MTLPARRRSVWVAAAVAVAALTTGCGGSTSGGHEPRAQALAVTDARSFLSTAVASDGRVVRHDQGGDTVSEGQGYALLLAVAIGDRPRFAQVWAWTQRNLQQPSGLFAYRWATGHIASATPAADADVQIAWALEIAGRRFVDPAYTSAARRIAAAVAAAEIGYDDQGRPTVAAGPWAVGNAKPATVEPGYWTPAADEALAALTGDGRWRALAAADLTHLQQLTEQGQQLPADWAQLGHGAAPHAVAAPDGSPVASGQDGLRALIWAAATPAGTTLAARWWRLVQPSAKAAPLTRSLTGEPTSSAASPLSAVAAAAGASAAGDTAARDQLLAAADTIEEQYPTYYGAAWCALGRVLLTTALLGSDGGGR